MLGRSVNIDDSFLEDLVERFEPEGPEEIFNMVFEGYFPEEFKSCWQRIMSYDGYEVERKILQQVKIDIINHLFLNICCIDVIKQYENSNMDFMVPATNALENMKELDCLPRNKTYQNGHLIDKGEKNLFMFPIEIKVPLAFPLYFDKSLAYFLIGMYKSDISVDKPVYIYKHCLFKEEEPNSQEMLAFCTNYFNLSIKGATGILDDYLFELEFSHILTLDIIDGINSITDSYPDIPRKIVAFTLSFLSLVPLYSRRSFIKLFLALGENAAPKPFSVYWAKSCIDAIINLSFISIPIMEKCYHYILRGKRQIKKDNPVLFKDNSNQKIINLLQELYNADINHIKAVSVPTLIKNDTYHRIQHINSLLTTIFRDDVFDGMSTIKKDELFIEVFDSNSESQIKITEEKLNKESIIANIDSILNGNLSSFIDEPFSSDTNKKKSYDRRLAACEYIKGYMVEYINNKL